MSAKSDDAPVRFERIDMDTAGIITVSIVVDGVQHRNGVLIPDNSTPEVIASKLDVLAFWIRNKAGIR